MKVVSKIVIASVLTCSFYACAYNTEDLPIPEDVEDVTPYTGPVVTYTSHVKSYIDNNCVGCHGSSGGVSLGTYAEVKSEADAGRILARAINGSGSGPMPPSGLMPQETLDTLQFWLDQGSPE